MVVLVVDIGSVKPSKGAGDGGGSSGSSDQLHPIQKAMAEMHGS